MWLPLLVVAALQYADTLQLRVLSLTDFHGKLHPDVPEWAAQQLGGAAYIKAAMDAAEHECGCPTIRVDAGDQMQGTLISNSTFGRSSVAVLNALGLHAAAIGNHDLDWGIDTLIARMQDAQYPWLAANILDSASGQPVSWSMPSAVVHSGGLDVGVVGYLASDSRELITTPMVDGLRFDRGAHSVRQPIRAMRAEGVDFVVLVAHAGAFCDDAGCRGELIDIARDLGEDRVDLMIGGHTGGTLYTVENGIPIMKPGDGGFTIGVVDLIRTGTGASRHHVRIDTVFADRYAADRGVEAIIEGYASDVELLAGEVIANLGEPLLRSGAQYTLGNLVAEAHRRAVNADVALVNNGGIRSSLRSSRITAGAIYSVLPFDNALVRVTTTGRTLVEALEHAIARRASGPDAHVAGITVLYDRDAPAGERVLRVTRIDGRAINEDDEITVAVPDFVIGGGDGYTMWQEGVRETTPISYRAAVIDYLRGLDRVPEHLRQSHFIPIRPATQ